VPVELEPAADAAIAAGWASVPLSDTSG
jgi:hypothetical protein